MKPLFTEAEFQNAKTHDKLPCECYMCGKSFLKGKHEINTVFKGRRGDVGKYCSRKCIAAGAITKISVECNNCQTTFTKQKHTVGEHNFCSQSCAASYNNKHKTYGFRRSKLELFLEEKLKEQFPAINCITNDRLTIGTELDFYFPDLRLAIEINGIIHYEPIYGNGTFEKVINKDRQKILQCAEKGIELIIVPNVYSSLTAKLKATIWQSVFAIISARLV